MRKKLKDSGGFTIVEMLCVVVILVMLCLLTNSGLSMAMRSYRDVTAESETQLLLNDLSDALADRLRYSIVTVKQNDVPNPDGTVTTTTEECTFSLENVKLKDNGEVESTWKVAPATGSEPDKIGWVSDDGIVMAGTKRLLSTGSYGGKLQGGKWRYVAETVNIKWDNDADPTNTDPGLNDLRDGQTLTFYIKLKVKDNWGGVSEETELTVRCLNPVKKEG